MNCPACGARNPDSAGWCSQCLRPLDEPAAPDPAPPASPLPPTSVSTPPPGSPAPVEPGGSTGERSFRTVDGEVEWRCPVCESWNALLVPSCAMCGHLLSTGSQPSAVAMGQQLAHARRVAWVVAIVVGIVAVVVLILLFAAMQGPPA